MLEIMILYTLSECEFTMYYLSKVIKENFGDFSKPSIGAIKPALTKLESAGFIKSRKTFSEGGKQTGYYSITKIGKTALKDLLLEKFSDNPIQFKNNAMVRIIACEMLSNDEKKEVFDIIKFQVEKFKLDAEKRLEKNTNLNPSQRILVDNLILEYSNFLKIINKLGE